MNCLEDHEKYLLQQFLAYSVLEKENFMQTYKTILQKFNININVNDREVLNLSIIETIRHINNQIKKFSLEIKNGTCELNCTSFYCLVRLYDLNELGKLSQIYTANELKIFKIILTTIIENDEGNTESRVLMDNIEANGDMKITNKDIRLVLEKLEKDYWIILNGSKIALHSRTLMELSQYLLEVYGPQMLSKCESCKEIAIIYEQCESCSIKMHKYCVKRVYQKKLSTNCNYCNAPGFSKNLVAKPIERPISATQQPTTNTTRLPITNTPMSQLNSSRLNAQRQK
jgi:hypothetical protein